MTDQDKTQKRSEAAKRGAETRRRNREVAEDNRLAALSERKRQVQAICDAHSGRHLFEGGHGISCFVSVTTNVGGKITLIRNAAYGNGLQLGADFSDAMADAGFSDFEVDLD